MTVRSARTLPAALTTPEPNSDPQRLFAIATTLGAGTALSLVSPKGLFLCKPETDPRGRAAGCLGEEIDIYAIGLGRTDPEFPSDRLFNSSFAVIEPPTVQIGGVTVTPSAAALIAPGVYVVRVKVPESQEPGERAAVLRVEQRQESGQRLPVRAEGALNSRSEERRRRPPPVVPSLSTAFGMARTRRCSG